MSLDTAFTTTPPIVAIKGESVQLRPLTELSQSIVAEALKGHESANTLFVLGYVVAAGFESGSVIRLINSDNFINECKALALELSEVDTQAVLDYLTAVFNRRAEAAITTPDAPGKP